MDSESNANVHHRTAPILPWNWEDYLYANSLTNKSQDNPEFEHIPPIESIQRNLAEERDLQLKNSDEYTFEVLPGPRLYDIYERNLLHRVKEYKWYHNNPM